MDLFCRGEGNRFRPSLETRFSWAWESTLCLYRAILLTQSVMMRHFSFHNTYTAFNRLPDHAIDILVIILNGMLYQCASPEARTNHDDPQAREECFFSIQLLVDKPPLEPVHDRCAVWWIFLHQPSLRECSARTTSRP